MSAAAVIIVGMLGLGVLVLLVVAWVMSLLREEGDQIVEPFRSGRHRLRGDDRDFFPAPKIRRRTRPTVTGYEVPLELENDEEEALPPPPLEFDGRNPNRAT